MNLKPRKLNGWHSPKKNSRLRAYSLFFKPKELSCFFTESRVDLDSFQQCVYAKPFQSIYRARQCRRLKWSVIPSWGAVAAFPELSCHRGSIGVYLNITLGPCHTVIDRSTSLPWVFTATDGEAMINNARSAIRHRLSEFLVETAPLSFDGNQSWQGEIDLLFFPPSLRIRRVFE